MANNKLILRTLTSPWVTPVADVTKNSVLTHEDVDNNFIYLRGELIESAGFSGGNVILRKINGGTITVPTGAGANTFVTGGTYDVNTSLVTLTRNDDVTINISGLTDTVVTGFTYDNANNITLSQNNGEVDQVVLINTMSGLTVNGTLSATTINAGDILSGGTNLSAIFQTISSGSGNTAVTAYTYDNANTLTISQNEGEPDLTATINTMTGLTINGTLSATTVNADTILSGGTNLSAIFQTISGSSSANTYTTGFTYDGANNITLSQNNGEIDKVVNISTMTGLTVSGTISATTVDAGDILSGGTNLSAIFQTIGGGIVNLATDDLIQDAEPRIYNMNGENLTFNNGYLTASRSTFGDVVNLNHSGGEIFFGGAAGVGTGGSNLIHDTKFNVASSTINCHRDFANTIGLCMVNFTTTGGLNNYAVVENQDGPLYIIAGGGNNLLFQSSSNDFIWLDNGGGTDMRLDAGVISVATWEGVVVKEQFGGTAQSTYATGDILYASTGDTLSKLSVGDNHEILTIVGGVPVWAPNIASGDTFTSGTTVVGNTIYFDRNDSLSAFTADLTSIVVAGDGSKGDIVVSNSGDTWTISANTIDNTKLADMPQDTFKGRYSSGTGDPEDIGYGDLPFNLPVTGDRVLGFKNSTSGLTEFVAARFLNTMAVGTSSAGFSSIDVDSSSLYYLTAQAQPIVVGSPGGSPASSQEFEFRFKDDGTARSITWDAAFVANGSLPLPSTTVVGETMFLRFLYNATTSKWELSYSSQAIGSDTYVTGFTYDNANKLTISRNEGQGDLDVIIDTMTGLTINGTLSATTIDADTILSGGTNLDTIFQKIGGVLSGDTFTTGFTYDNANNLTISRNEGQGDLDVNISTMTGLTINGTLSATTINAGDIFSGGTNLNTIINNAAGADTSVTAFTYDNANKLTISQNEGEPDLNVIINSMTGLTVTGDIDVGGTLTATTIDAGDILSGGTNLSSIFATVDTVFDPDAIHNNVDAEITAITAKSALVDSDTFLIEDSAASDAKKSTTLSNLKTAIGTGTPGVAQSVQSYQIANTDANSPTTGSYYACKVIPTVSRDVTQMQYFVTNSNPSATVYVGIYTNASVLMAQGNGGTTTVGLQTVTLGSTVSLVANTEYYFCIFEAVGAANFASTVTTPQINIAKAQYYSGTPTPLPGVIGGSNTNKSFWMSAF